MITLWWPQQWAKSSKWIKWSCSMILQDFKDENVGKKLKRKRCGKTRNGDSLPIEWHNNRNALETVDLCPKHGDANRIYHVRWKCWWGRDTFDWHTKQEQPSAYLERSSYGDSLYGCGGGHPALGRTPGTEIRQYWHYRDSHRYNTQHILKDGSTISHRQFQNPKTS